MRKLLLPAVIMIASPLACDLEKTGNQLLSRKVLVGSLLSTPSVDLTPSSWLGLDGGLPFDAGVDAGVVSIPGQTAAFVFFGTRTSESLDTAPEAISNATVNLNPAGGPPLALKNDGNGRYSKTSADDSSFGYQQGKDYLFTASAGGESFVGKVESVPALERLDELHPPKGFVELAANTSLSLTRKPAPANQERNLGFVTVVPIGDNGEKADPTYTNVPTTPLAFLKLVAAPNEWKQDRISVPGSAFPNPQKTYLVVFQAAKLGGPESSNLFTGSAILAGTSDVGVVRTR